MNYSNYAKNVTNVEPLSFNWPVLVLTSFIASGLIGNLLVCVAVSTEPRLRNVTNYFLFSLAVTDSLVSAVVMPMGLIAELNGGRWSLGLTACVAYCYADVFLCSSSIVHMTCISLDRYLGVSRPFKARNKSPLVVAMKIVAVWLITLLISCPLGVLTMNDPAQVFDHRRASCQIVNPYFAIYGSSLAFVVPCTVMFVAYVKTVRLLRNRAPLSNVSADGAFRRNTVIKTRVEPNSTIRRRSSTPAMDSDNDFSGRYSSRLAFNSRHSAATSRQLSADLSAEHRHSLLSNNKRRPCFEEDPRFRSEKGRTPRPLPPRRYSTELSSERKATRVLGLVFGCFFVCWTPFFAANLTMAFCAVLQRPCWIPRWLDSLFLWLGYVSSTLNPVIYTAFNARFRKAFIRIATSRCRTAVGGERDRRRRPASSFSYSINRNGARSNGLTDPEYSDATY